VPLGESTLPGDDDAPEAAPTSPDPAADGDLFAEAPTLPPGTQASAFEPTVVMTAPAAPSFSPAPAVPPPAPLPVAGEPPSLERASVPEPPHPLEADLDEPAWTAGSFSNRAGEADATSLLDEVEPTLPGTPASLFGTAETPLVPEPPAPPTTQAFDAVVEGGTIAPSPLADLEPPVTPEPEPLPGPEDSADTLRGRPAFVVPDAPAPAPALALSSATLAELYFDQGLHDRALEVYEELAAREPGNERLRARLAELRAFAPEHANASGASGDAGAARRAAVLRTISRLEGLLAAVRRR
jgi:hypothetical protein